MKKFLVILLLVFLSACALNIRPNPTDLNAVVDPSDHSITLKQQSLTISARVQDAAVGGFSSPKPIASFYLEAVNRGGVTVSIPADTIQLQDDQGHTFAPLPPAEVSATLNPPQAYLVPFPYVGYLDVTGLESIRTTNAMTSARPYVNQGLPAAEVEQQPEVFDGSSLTPSQRQSGVVYFEIDLYQVKAVKLTIHPPGMSPFTFPFLIEN